jgi:enamine deaminase RidA (YjgF/YER057c/UK114 family)
VIYVVSADRADLAAVWARLRASPIADALTSASTLLGVAQLGFPGQLVEIDVTAVV